MARRLALLLLIGASCFPRGWNRADPTIPETMGFPFTAGPYLVRMDQHQTAVALRAPLAEAPTLEWWAVTSTTAPPERKNKVTFDSRSGGLWAAAFALVAWRSVRRTAHPRSAGRMIAAFAAYSAVRLFIFARSDYDRERLSFLFLMTGLIIISGLFFAGRSTTSRVFLKRADHGAET